jgi:hypothetical protein
MTPERFKELENKYGTNPMQLCYVIFCEEKSIMPIAVFQQEFSVWLEIYKFGDIYSAIEYFKNNKIK